MLANLDNAVFPWLPVSAMNPHTLPISLHELYEGRFIRRPCAEDAVSVALLWRDIPSCRVLDPLHASITPIQKCSVEIVPAEVVGLQPGGDSMLLGGRNAPEKATRYCAVLHCDGIGENVDGRRKS